MNIIKVAKNKILASKCMIDTIFLAYDAINDEENLMFWLLDIITYIFVN